jgi:hypothetical protein
VLYVEDRSFFILSTAASTPVTINGGTKRDLFQVGGLPGFVGTVTLNNILGTVTLNGNGDNDTVSLNDQDTAFNQLYSLTATTFSRTGIAAINYASSEAVNINAGGGADTINVLDHPAGAVVTVDGRGGLDDIKVNSDGIGIASVIFPTTQDLVSLDILAGGTATLAAGGDKVIDTDGLTVAATGKLDLNDNDLIVDYTGATPIAVMQALVRSAGTAARGPAIGITSTTARNNAQHNTTLGANGSCRLQRHLRQCGLVRRTNHRHHRCAREVHLLRRRGTSAGKSTSTTTCEPIPASTTIAQAGLTAIST